jgi:hypothetical protein
MILIEVAALSGDPDLFVSTRGPIENRQDYPLRGTRNGGELIRVCSANVGQEASLTDTPFDGTYFIGVFGYNGAQFTITTSIVLQNGTDLLNVTDLCRNPNH